MKSKEWIGIQWQVRKDLFPNKRIFDQKINSLLSSGKHRSLKIGKLKSVYLLPYPLDSIPQLILKERRHFSLKGQWKRVTEGFRLGREFENYLEAQRRGVRVPQVLALGRKRRFGLLAESYLLLEFIEQGRTLTEIWLSQTRTGDIRMKRSFLSELAAFVADLLQKGIIHQDFSANNILVRHAGGERNFYLIDLDPCLIENSPTQEAQQICLSQLVLHLMQLEPRGESSVVRFLVAVLKHLGLKSEDRKKWFLATVEKTRRRYFKRNLPKADKKLPADFASMTKDERARWLVNRSIPMRLDFARPEGTLGAETFIPKERRVRRAFLREVAFSVRAAHWHGLRVRRISLKNLIVRLDPARGVQISFLDPDDFEVGAPPTVPLPFAEQIEDLKSCLAATKKGIMRWRKTDRLRFLKHYLGPWYSRNIHLRRYYQALST